MLNRIGKHSLPQKPNENKRVELLDASLVAGSSRPERFSGEGGENNSCCREHEEFSFRLSFEGRVFEVSMGLRIRHFQSKSFISF